MNAEIYTKANCPFCTKAKSLLKLNGISYTEYFITTDLSESANDKILVTREQLLERAPNARTVPQIWLDNVYIGGCTDLEKYLNKN